MSQARAGHNHRRWRLTGHKKAHIDTVRNDINVTPLVDVMLVLLIIFMLMVMLMGRGKEVALPSAKNFSAEKDKHQPVITVDADGKLYVEKSLLGAVNESTLKEMDQRINALWKAPDYGGGQEIYLKADSSITYDEVSPVILYLNKQMAMQSIDLAISKASSAATDTPAAGGH